MLVAITGANGFLGAYLSDLLEKNNLKVRRIQRNKDKDGVFIKEINKDTKWHKALENVDVLVHCAAKVHVLQDKEYTKNSALNKVLNETVGGIPQGDKGAYPTMGGGAYTSDRVNELMGGNPMMANTEEGKEKRRQVGAVESLKAQGVSSDQVGEDVVNALTRDYSGLMKVINKKKTEHFRP